MVYCYYFPLYRLRQNLSLSLELCSWDRLAIQLVPGIPHLYLLRGQPEPTLPRGLEVSSEDLNSNTWAGTTRALPDEPSPHPTLGTQSEENIQSCSFKISLIIRGYKLENLWMVSEIISGTISDTIDPNMESAERVP